MRTTVEIPDELRAKLIQLATERGLRGYSELITEALREYLRRHLERSRELDDLLEECEGMLDDRQVEVLRQRIDDAWNRWASSTPR